MSGQAFELGQANLGHAPEALDAVDVDGSPVELVPGVIDPEVAIAEVDQAVVAGQPSELMTARGSTRPRMMLWSVGFEQSGTISV